MKLTLEIAAFSFQSALIAAGAGANRIEICDNVHEGGTTPSYGTVKTLKSKIDIPVFAMLRPHGGDFLYTEEEFWVMEKDLALFKELGCEGVVLGFLQPDGSVDVSRTSRFVELAYPMEVTFHRAFDRARDPFEALENIIACGCQRILTSGQMPEAPAGIPLLKQLVETADDRIIIMPGCGVTSQNIATIASGTGATELHSSAKKVQPSTMQYINGQMHEQLNKVVVDADEVAALKQALSTVAIATDQGS